MFIALFLSTALSGSVRPDGWAKRSDARPFLPDIAVTTPHQAADLAPGLKLENGWEVHVRQAPKGGEDDWRARFYTSSQPISFRHHMSVWPGDGWVWYQLVGRMPIAQAGTYRLGLGFMTGDNGTGCFGQLVVGGAVAMQVDLPVFFAQRKPKDPNPDELVFAKEITLEPGSYDAIVSVGCHPTKIGKEIPPRRLEAWHESRFFIVIQTPGEARLRPMRGSEIAHVTR